MPQLDKVTFLSQFFWLCVFFFAFYVISLKYFLPNMSRVLKYRKKRFDASHQGKSNMQEENSRVRDSTDRLLEKGLKNSKDILNHNLQGTQNWLTQYANQTNQTQLKEGNHSYLYSLGERCLSHNLSLQGGFSDFSNQVFLTILINKLNNSIGKAPTAVRSESKAKKK